MTSEEAARIARAEIAKALRAMREQEDIGASYRWSLNAGLNAVADDYHDPTASKDHGEAQAARSPRSEDAPLDPLPPLDGPEIPGCPSARDLTTGHAFQYYRRALDWERIARAERAAREAERAKADTRIRQAQYGEQDMEHSRDSWMERAEKAEAALRGCAEQRSAIHRTLVTCEEALTKAERERDMMRNRANRDGSAYADARREREQALNDLRECEQRRLSERARADKAQAEAYAAARTLEP